MALRLSEGAQNVTVSRRSKSNYTKPPVSVLQTIQRSCCESAWGWLCTRCVLMWEEVSNHWLNLHFSVQAAFKHHEKTVGLVSYLIKSVTRRDERERGLLPSEVAWVGMATKQMTARCNCMAGWVSIRLRILQRPHDGLGTVRSECEGLRCIPGLRTHLWLSFGCICDILNFDAILNLELWGLQKP